MFCDYLQPQDLYTAGIGFDLGGAYLLSRGLIMAPRKLTQVSGSYYGGNDYLAASVAQDRIDAISGVGALLLGFSLQLVGYLVTLLTTPHEHHGWREAVTGGAFAVAALGCALVAGWAHGKARLKPTLVEMAHYLGDGTPLDHPRADMLDSWGTTGLGIEHRDGESSHAFLRRVFGVDDAVVPIDGGGFRPIVEEE